MRCEVVFPFGSVRAVRALELGFDAALVALVSEEVLLPSVALAAVGADPTAWKTEG
jgi:hypothetical protein